MWSRAYPDVAVLRYYLAEGYRKQALTLRRTDPQESERLQALALSQLRACSELGLPRDLRNPAAQLFNVMSKGSEPDTEQKILGGACVSVTGILRDILREMRFSEKKC